MNEDEKIKGAFKDYPQEQQPARIPLAKFPALAAKVEELLSPYGKIHIPDATKKSEGKKTTGDLDVMFIPHSLPHKNKGSWMETVRKAIPGIVVWKTNGPQLMMVVKGLIDDQQYMVDVLLSNEDEWDFRKVYHGFGVILPAVLGSFARSLGYKYGQDGLYRRQRDLKGNYHNLKLTNDPVVAFKILGLNPAILQSNDLYDPEKVADWIIASPRFDSDIWHEPPQDDGLTIVVKNQKSHRAARQKSEVIAAYNKIDAAKKKATIINNGFEIERKLLGNQFVDNLLAQLNKIEKASNPPITGQEVMQIMGIPPGPAVGQWVKYILNHPKIQGLEPEEANQTARTILIAKKMMQDINGKPAEPQHLEGIW